MPQVIGLAVLVGAGIGLWRSGMLDKFIKPSAATNNTAGTSTPSTPAKTDPAKTSGTEMASVTPTPDPSMIPTAPEDGREKIFALEDPVWESPTKGPAIEAKYLAPGAQAVISIRLAALLKHPEGEKLTDGGVTGGLGSWLRETLPKSVGLTGDKIEQVVISLLDNGACAAESRLLGAHDRTGCFRSADRRLGQSCREDGRRQEVLCQGRHGLLHPGIRRAAAVFHRP